MKYLKTLRGDILLNGTLRLLLHKMQNKIKKTIHVLDSGKGPQKQNVKFNFTSWTGAIASAYKADVRAWMYVIWFLISRYSWPVMWWYFNCSSFSPLLYYFSNFRYIQGSKSAKCLLSKSILIFSNIKREETLPVLMQAMASEDRQQFTYRKERKKRQERTQELNHDVRHPKQYLGFSEGNFRGSHLLWLHCRHGDQTWALL